jgi:hypothetical protein
MQSTQAKLVTSLGCFTAPRKDFNHVFTETV